PNRKDIPMSNTVSNVTPIEAKQVAPAAHFTIFASLDGFPIEVEVEGKAGDLRALVERLKAIGAEPPTVATSSPAQAKPAGAPVSLVPQSPMNPSRKPGKFYCAKKADDGEYCRETA